MWIAPSPQQTPPTLNTEPARPRRAQRPAPLRTRKAARPQGKPAQGQALRLTGWSPRPDRVINPFCEEPSQRGNGSGSNDPREAWCVELPETPEEEIELDEAPPAPAHNLVGTPRPDWTPTMPWLSARLPTPPPLTASNQKRPAASEAVSRDEHPAVAAGVQAKAAALVAPHVQRLTALQRSVAAAATQPERREARRALREGVIAATSLLNAARRAAALTIDPRLGCEDLMVARLAIRQLQTHANNLQRCPFDTTLAAVPENTVVAAEVNL
eukprot:m.453068 g.453068  ORF g.453068 m.453068 type:complete len:271 (-) comp20431_c0_seq1:93-905(-)